MPWKAPTGSGGVHVSRRADGSTRIKGMREYDPAPPTPEDLRADELDRISALMSEAPHGVVGEPFWWLDLMKEDNA